MADAFCTAVLGASYMDLPLWEEQLPAQESWVIMETQTRPKKGRAFVVGGAGLGEAHTASVSRGDGLVLVVMGTCRTHTSFTYIRVHTANIKYLKS